ncbi:hypothetical protein HDZ31DRAFT_70584, partial [Schizophyllum fasciatum]
KRRRAEIAQAKNELIDARERLEAQASEIAQAHEAIAGLKAQIEALGVGACAAEDNRGITPSTEAVAEAATPNAPYVYQDPAEQQLRDDHADEWRLQDQQAAGQDASTRTFLDLTKESTVLAGAETLLWRGSNVLTWLPYLPGALTVAGKEGGNVLAEEAQLLRRAAEFPDSRDTLDFVRHVAWGAGELNGLATQARGLLEHGIVVVLEGCPPAVHYEQGDPTGDVGFWEHTMGCNPALPRDFQDMRLHVKGDAPYERMSMREFCANINLPGRIRACHSLVAKLL